MLEDVLRRAKLENNQISPHRPTSSPPRDNKTIWLPKAELAFDSKTWKSPFRALRSRSICSSSQSMEFQTQKFAVSSVCFERKARTFSWSRQKGETGPRTECSLADSDATRAIFDTWGSVPLESPEGARIPLWRDLENTGPKVGTQKRRQTPKIHRIRQRTEHF